MGYTIWEEEKAKINGFEIPVQCIAVELEIQNNTNDLHYHDYVELLYGQDDCDVQVMCYGKTYRMRSGDLVIINSKQPHTVTALRKKSRYTVIKFMPQILYAAEQSALEFKYILPFITSNEKYSKLFTKNNVEKTEIPNIINDVLDEWNKKEYGYEVALRVYVIKIALWLIRRWYAENPSASIDISGESDDAIKFIQKSIEFAQKNFPTATSFEAAQVCNLSYSYFSRLFKRVMKKSFTEYVNYVRITEAQRMLTSTDKSITDVALDIGFSTTSYFIDKFKRQVHMTPMQFRKKYKSQ